MGGRITFQVCRLATSSGAEAARLGCVDETIVSIFVPVSGDEGGPWYLVQGFGPWAQEGMIFATLDGAANWIAQELPADWSGHAADPAP